MHASQARQARCQDAACLFQSPFSSTMKATSLMGVPEATVALGWPARDSCQARPKAELGRMPIGNSCCSCGQGSQAGVIYAVMDDGHRQVPVCPAQ